MGVIPGKAAFCPELQCFGIVKTAFGGLTLSRAVATLEQSRMALLSLFRDPAAG
jgi:hypothetical protein